MCTKIQVPGISCNELYPLQDTDILICEIIATSSSLSFILSLICKDLKFKKPKIALLFIVLYRTEFCSHANRWANILKNLGTQE